jgi:hypothetical protein
VRPGTGPEDPIVYEVEGAPTGNRAFFGHFGYMIAALDDLDGDGVPEFAASASSFLLPDERRGFVAVFSGRTGSRLRWWLPPAGASGYGLALAAAGDADRDGFRDLAVLYGTGAFDVLSPVSGEVLYQVPRPPGEFRGDAEFLVPLGDVDGDGIGDLVVSLGSYNDAPSDLEHAMFRVGRVAAHSGADGRLLWERFGEERSLFGLESVAVGDVSGDEVPDLVVGEPNLALGQYGPVQDPPPRLLLLSGSDGSTLEVHVGEPWQLLLGRGFAFLGDTDGNGRVEVVAAAPWAYNGTREEAGWAGVYELPGFQLRYEIWGEHGQDFNFTADHLGCITAEAGDADGDGAMDFLLSTDHVRTLGVGRVYGRLYLHSGRTGRLLQVYEGEHSGNPSGATYFTALAPFADIDGDGRDEFLVGAGGWIEDAELRGRVQVLRYQPERVPFRRGDIDGDDRYTLSDVIRVVHGVLGAAPVEPCPLAYDINGDSRLNTSDIYAILCYAFYCSTYFPPEPATPSLRCGRYARLKPARSQVPLSCTAFPGCAE